MKGGKQKCNRRGLTLVEVSVSTLLVGMLVVGALSSVSMSARLAHSSMNRTSAAALAEDLIENILPLDYQDSTSPSFGPELDETASVRSSFDDVDDFDDWTESPPADNEGNEIASNDWSRSVTVTHVDATNPNLTTLDATDTGVKRITVSVSFRGDVVTTLTAIRTDSSISMVPNLRHDNTTERFQFGAGVTAEEEVDAESQTSVDLGL